MGLYGFVPARASPLLLAGASVFILHNKSGNLIRGVCADVSFLTVADLLPSLRLS